MIRAQVNGKSIYKVEIEKNTIQLNGNDCPMDIIQISRDHWHVIHQGKSITVHLLEFDHATKSMALSINNNVYQVTLRDHFDDLLHKLGFDKIAGKKINNLKAPMPGLVLDVKIQMGQLIKKGDTILVLEAMKMENILKAESDAEVKAIKIKKGDKVEKNELLVEFV